MASHDIDREVTDHLSELPNRDEAPQTVAEIAKELALTTAQVRASLKRLAGFSEVRQVGEAFGGGKTWALTSDPRFKEA